MKSSTSSRARRIGLIAGLFCVVLGGCFGRATQVREQVGATPVKRCLLLTTNDSEAHFDGKRSVTSGAVQYLGTIDRVATEKRRLLAQRPGAVLLLSAGDVLQGRFMARSDKNRRQAARDALQMYERAGYDLAVVGNHEFDAGPAVLRHALEGLSRYQFVVSNLKQTGTTLDNTGERLYRRWLVRSCGGLKIGFLGLLTPSTRSISKFGDTRFSEPGDPVYPAARIAVAALRQQGVEVVVALTHLGLKYDLKLAKHVAGIDVIVGGHSHTLLQRWRMVGSTIVVQAGERFGHLGHLELVGGPSSGLDRKRSSWTVVPIGTGMESDGSIRQAIARLRTQLPAERVVGKRSIAWSLGSKGRSRYGRRVARAVARHVTSRDQPVDAILLNSGGLRTNDTYPVGPVTNLELRAIHPFNNRIVIAELSAAELRAVLEHACTGGHRAGQGLRVLLHGLTMGCDRNQMAVKYRYENGRATAIASLGKRVIDLKVAGRPIDPKRRYRLATNDYLARGGSGYWQLSQVARVCDDGKPMAADQCKRSATLAEVVEAAVGDGSFDQPLQPR